MGIFVNDRAWNLKQAKNRRENGEWHVKKANEAKKIIREYSKDFEGNLDDTMCRKLAWVSRNSFYKYKRELKEE